MFGLKNNEQIYLRGYYDGFNNNHLNATPRFIGPAFNLTSDSEAATVVKEFEITDSFESSDSYNVGFNDSTFVDDIKTKLNIVYNSIDGKTVNIDLSKALVPERTGLFDDGFMIISFKHNGKTYEFDYRNEMGYPVATGTVLDEKIGVIKTPSDWQLYSNNKEEIISTYHGKAITASGSNVVYIYPEWKNKIYTFTSVDSESYSINFDGITADKEHRTININCELAEWTGFSYQWQPYDGSRDYNITVNLIGITEEYLSKKNLLETVNNMKTYPGITVNFLPAEVIPPEAEDASLNWTYTVDDATNTITLNEYIGNDSDVMIRNKYAVDGNVYENVSIKQFSGETNSPFYGKRDNITSVASEDGVKFSNLNMMFKNCPLLESVDFSNANMSEVTAVGSAFSGTTKIKYLNLSGVDFSELSQIDYMISDNSEVKNINFSGMNLPKISEINNSGIFGDMASLESVNLSNINLPILTSMSSAFYGCTSLKHANFSGAKMPNLTNMYNTFQLCDALESVDFSNADMSSVTDVQHLFSEKPSLKTANFSGAKLKTCSALFIICPALESVDFSNADMSLVTSVSAMFSSSANLVSVDFSNVDLSSVTSLSNFFNGASSLVSVDFSTTKIPNITSTYGMFGGCTLLDTIYVQDEATKTMIEASGNFPSTATVIVGSPE